MRIEIAQDAGNLCGALAALEELVLAVLPNMHTTGELGHVVLASCPQLSGACAVGVDAESIESVLADALGANVARLCDWVVLVSAAPQVAGALALLLASDGVKEIGLHTPHRSVNKLALSAIYNLPIKQRCNGQVDIVVFRCLQAQLQDMGQAAQRGEAVLERIICMCRQQGRKAHVQAVGALLGIVVLSMVVASSGRGSHSLHRHRGCVLEFWRVHMHIDVAVGILGLRDSHHRCRHNRCLQNRCSRSMAVWVCVVGCMEH